MTKVSGSLSQELEQVRKLCESKVPNSKLVTCTEGLIRVEITKSNIKSLVVVLQFPEDYPNHEVLVELRSKTLNDKLLDGLTKVCEEEARKYLGESQILLVLKLVSKFIEENPLCSCSGEISSIKRELLRRDDVIKLKQKTSTVTLRLQEGLYFFSCNILVPNNYPESQAQIETTESNFPDSFCRVFIAHATEIARKCVEPPLNTKKIPKNAPAFRPQPSVLAAVKFLIPHVHRYPTEMCPKCNERCFPECPDEVIQEENHDQHVERILCGHLYHLKCLIIYLKTPPFAGGKKCLTCKELVCHEKYKVTPQLAEARWAHQQARQREIDEVVEFLS